MKILVALAALVLSHGLIESAYAQSKKPTRGQCTRACGGVAGGCAANTLAAQRCFNKCMGTNECRVSAVPKKRS